MQLLTLQALPMTLVSGTVVCFAIGYFQNYICGTTGSYEDGCQSMTNYANTIASFSALGALILFFLVSMGILSMPRGGMMGMGMGMY